MQIKTQDTEGQPSTSKKAHTVPRGHVSFWIQSIAALSASLSPISLVLGPSPPLTGLGRMLLHTHHSLGNEMFYTLAAVVIKDISPLLFPDCVQYGSILML